MIVIDQRRKEMATNLKKLVIEHVRAITYHGEEKIGGELLSRKEFAKMRESRLEITGKLEEKTVQLLYTRRSCSEGEFAGLCELIGEKGILEAEFSNERKFETISGKKVKLREARIDMKLTADDGSFAPKFTPAPTAAWAAKFGAVGTEFINYGTNPQNLEKFKALRQSTREETPLATDSDTSI
jgi:hypothetical protein